MSPQEARRRLLARRSHLVRRIAEVEAGGGNAHYDRGEADALGLAVIALDHWSQMNREKSQLEGREQPARKENR